ncbi:viral polymerase [Parrot bornavirus 7]|uniref:RNA-directed RNA polymerase n=1 Tax=Parrot bornavirus 7 TaxID=1548719 RepID=I6Z0N8_9MONO|nr:RNA-dependent RNA polymerase [Parrot bornavirus 7]AFN70809.2 viral polymerase [Parrot bornavirus 7]
MSFHARLDREEEAPRKVVRINRTDQSLKNPLLGTEVSFCLQSRSLPHHIRALEYIKAHNLQSRDYYKIFRRISLQPQIYPIGVLIRAAETIVRVVTITWGLRDIVDSLSPAIRYALTNPRVRSCLELHITYQRIIQQVSYSREADVGPKKLGEYQLMFLQSLVVVYNKEISCLMTYNHFLAAADTIKSRCHLLITSVVQGALLNTGSFLDDVFALIDIVDSLDLSHDDYFNVIKSILPYSQGLIMMAHNKTVSTSFATLFDIPVLVPELDRLLKKLLVRDPRLLLMIASIQKSWYFPEIDMLEGSKEQLRKMRIDLEPPHALLSMGEDSLAMFRAEFIKGYLAKHSKWPSTHLTPSCNRSIRSARELGKWNPSFDRNWRWFKDVIILKVSDLDLDPDFNDIVSDKAIINSRKDWVFEYNTAAYRYKHGHKLERPPERSGPSRLVNALIDGRLDSIPELLEPFYRGSVNFEDRITVLVPKEKELKVKGRFFSKQSLAIRIYQVVAEASIKNEVMPYLKTHSMTMSSTSLTHLLNKLSNLIVNGDSFVINLDYSSWCNAFRPELQIPLCRQLDQMFDCGFFFRTGCLLPCFTTFIVQDRFNPPLANKLEPVEDMITCAHGTKTMGEGMRQKLWTILTSCWEIMALREAQVSFNILGQGDNQTIIIYKSITETNQVLADRALGCLYKYARLAGHTLKVEECWVSDCLYEYGKRLFFEGIPVPGSLKQLSRVTDSTGELFPNLYSKLACLVSSCLSAAMSDISPWVALTTGVCLYLIELYVELPMRIMQEEDLLVTLCLVGPSLGGLPTPATLPSVFFRGMSDPLPLQLALLKTLIHITGLSVEFINSVVKLRIASHPDWLSLITDPTSLNIQQLFRPERQIRKWVEQAILTSSHSSRVATFFQQPLTEMAQILARDLSNMMPMRPRDMSALFSLSNVAYGLSIIDLFQKSSTVVSANQALHLEDVVLESHRYKQAVIEHILDRSVGLDLTPYLSGCTYIGAKGLRRLTWGRDLVGVTMPFVAEQFNPVESSQASVENYKDAILYVPQEPLRERHLYARGNQPLYLGSNTAIKVQRGELTGLSRSRAAGLVRDTLVLYQWYKVRKVVDPNLNKLMDRFLREKGYVSDARPVVHGGTLTHRLPSRGDSRQGLTGYVNLISTWLKFSSDYMTTYSQSSDDYTIHFQHVLTYGCLYADVMVRSGKTVSEPYLLTASCHDCFERIESEEFVLASEPQYQGAEWLISKPISVPEMIADEELDLDPCISASLALGMLISKSLLVDIRHDKSDITDQKTWANLERFSLADLRKLPWAIVFRSAWRYLLEVRLLQFERASLVRLLSLQRGPTFDFVYNVMRESSLLLESTPAVETIRYTNFRNRRDLISRVLMIPIMNAELASAEVSRISKHYDSISDTNIDLYMASTRGVAIKPATYCNETNDYTEQGVHIGNFSFGGGTISEMSQVYKMAVRKLKLGQLYIYPDTPTAIAVDLCHLPGLKIILVLHGNPSYYEVLLEIDLCSAVRSRVALMESLAASSSPGVHVGGPSDSLHLHLVGLGTISYAHPCLEELNFNVYLGDEQVDISSMCCLMLSSPCDSLFKPVYRSASCLRRALIDSYWSLVDMMSIRGFDIRLYVEEFDDLVIATKSVLGLEIARTVTYYFQSKLKISTVEPRGTYKKITINGRIPSPYIGALMRAGVDKDSLTIDLPIELLSILFD